MLIVNLLALLVVMYTYVGIGRHYAQVVTIREGVRFHLILKMFSSHHPITLFLKFVLLFFVVAE